MLRADPDPADRTEWTEPALEPAEAMERRDPTDRSELCFVRSNRRLVLLLPLLTLTVSSWKSPIVMADTPVVSPTIMSPKFGLVLLLSSPSSLLFLAEAERLCELFRLALGHFPLAYVRGDVAQSTDGGILATRAGRFIFGFTRIGTTITTTTVMLVVLLF